ncbi:hypothetical protein Tco_1102792 [Tanacetum coccineum]
MAKNHRERAIPPPMIGKIGPYTVFVTPPPVVTPEPQFESNPVQKPPVLPPPVQYEKPGSGFGSKAGFFWDALAKVQNGIFLDTLLDFEFVRFEMGLV